MKKLVGWALLILVVGCHQGGEKAETKQPGEVKSQEGSTAVQSVQSVQPAPEEAAAPTAAAPAVPPGQPAEPPSPAALKAPTSPIAEAIAKKEVENISFESQKGLQGIKQIGVVVWGFMDPEAEKAGLTHEMLMSEVESKLEKIGIKVVQEGQNSEDPGRAIMYVKLDIRKRHNFPVYLGYIDVSLFQFVYLGRNPKLVLLSETWTTHSQPFLYGQENLVQFCREQVKGEMDSFIKDYAKYNTGVKVPSPSPEAVKAKPAAPAAAAPSSPPSQAKPKPAAPAAAAPSSPPSQAKPKPAAPEPPASAPKPAPGGAAKPAGKKP